MIPSLEVPTAVKEEVGEDDFGLDGMDNTFRVRGRKGGGDLFEDEGEGGVLLNMAWSLRRRG